MQLGIIGLGRMGGNMRERLRRAGHDVVGFDRNPDVSDAADLSDLISKLAAPRVVWSMVPAEVTEQTIDDVAALMSDGDLIIDGGNSKFTNDAPRAERLAKHGIGYLDCGVSGGVWGIKYGYGLMVGGTDADVAKAQPIFDALKPAGEFGFAHAGGVGAGHYAKMVHNGIEYGLMQAYAEGFNVLKHANVGLNMQETDAETTPLRDPDHYKYELDVAAISELWRRGSVISSWLLDLTAQALHESPNLDDYAGHVSDSGEGRWTVQAAVEEGVPAPVLAASLFDRFASRGEADWGNRVLSAMRKAFGGHLEKSPEQ
jgi:6-phosphogluconate dehydrogenase